MGGLSTLGPLVSYGGLPPPCFPLIRTLTTALLREILPSTGERAPSPSHRDLAFV